MYNFESYFEADDGNLWSYIETKSYHMADEDEEYQSILEEMEKILDSHPNIREVFENNNPKELSIDDSKALYELQTLDSSKRDIDMKNSFYLGSRNLYYYLKQMKIID